MKLVIQRVESATVSEFETGTVMGSIEGGLFILMGIGKEDMEGKADILAKKVANLRIMADGEKKMNLSVKDTSDSILVVSQFTLYSNTKDGNRPSFINAAGPEEAKRIYERFILKLREEGIKVQTGKFGSYMRIEANLDGPVTIIMEE